MADAGLEFDLGGVSCDPRPAGRRCLVRLRVRNLGETGRIYAAGDQVLVDSGGGRRRHNFAAARTSGLPNPDGAYLAGGASAEAALVFDLPDGREAASLEVHGRSGDRGETIPLP